MKVLEAAMKATRADRNEGGISNSDIPQILVEMFIKFNIMLSCDRLHFGELNQ